MPNRLEFDFTCKNLQDIIFSKPKWGIDYNAVPHDLSRRVKVPVEVREVVRFQGNIVWIKNISYPFEIPTQENISLNDTIYAKIVLVNKEWFIEEFLFDPIISRDYTYI